VREAAALVTEVYRFSCVGGNAHIALDDWNLEDAVLTWCLDEALPLNVHEAGPEQLNAERTALLAMRALTIPERASALALASHLWG